MHLAASVWLEDTETEVGDPRKLGAAWCWRKTKNPLLPDHLAKKSK